MGKRFKGLFIGIVVALVLMLVLPNAIFAAQTRMSATGDVTYISGTVGFPTGMSGNYKVMSRTVRGTFVSGDLSGDYSMTYKSVVDLNTQAGDFSGRMTTDLYEFDMWGTSQPVTWTPSPDSPVGFIGSSSASGTWQGHGWSGSGTFSSNFSFVPTLDGHIDYILPGSTFTINGQWNLR